VCVDICQRKRNARIICTADEMSHNFGEPENFNAKIIAKIEKTEKCCLELDETNA